MTLGFRGSYLGGLSFRMSDPETRTPDTAAAADVTWLVGRALQTGDVGSGWVIHRVERLEGGSRFAVATSLVPLRVVVEIPREGSRYHAQTERLGIWVEAGDPATHRLHQEITRIIADRIRNVERGGEYGWSTSRRPPEKSAKPMLYLVPGHLGDPDDLSIRALQVLTSVPMIFVESGKTDEVRALLVRFKLRPADGPGAPEIVELDDDGRPSTAVERWRHAVAAGLDTCLFGSNEGIPGFCDPGKALVMAAAEMADTVQVRSVGGSSALGHALMRVPSRLQAFEFWGLLHSRSDAGRLRAAIRRFRVPLVVFSHGASVREYLPGAIHQSGLRRGTIHLLAAFTGDEEQVHALSASTFVPPSAEVLRDYQPVVIVIEADRMRRDPGNTPIHRFIAWARKTLTRRSDATPEVG